MKGFNIAPQPGSSSTLLEPTSDLITTWKERQRENQESFGSSRSEIFSLGAIPKKSKATKQSHSPASTSKKKRWDALIEAAKTHKVSKKFTSKIFAIDRFN